jgi:DNA adenine methylase
MSRLLTPPLKWHGGKSYLAKKIIALMPSRVHNPNAPAKGDPGWLNYCEPYFGGGAVLLAQDPEGISEVVNDLHAGLTNFWRVLQNDADFARFQRILETVPFSEWEWQDAAAHLDDSDSVRRAVAFFIRCRQSLAGRLETFAPLSRNRTRRGMNEQASAWINAVEGLPAVSARLHRVVVLNRPAIEVIQQQDGPRSLIYCDPPYPHGTRTASDVYTFEMSNADHRELLDVLLQCKGKVMLSGYSCPLYDMALADWSRHTFDLPNNAAGGPHKQRKTECIWCNF